MAKEIERKFLMAKGASIPIPDNFVKLNIKQAYISVEKDKQVRVRLTREGKWMEKATICVKYTAKLVRDEFEFDVELPEAKNLYKKCDWAIEKKRLAFNLKGGTEHYDVDTFPNGIIFVEVEFKSEKAMNKWKKPHWIGKEITGESKYSNITLAKKNLKFW